MTRYQQERDAFLESCGPMTNDERDHAIRMFDRTSRADAAKFVDSVERLVECVILKKTL